MKKILLTLFTLVFMEGAAMASFIDHPQYAKITTFTQTTVNTIKAKQDEFFTVNGRYFQGLWLLGDQMVDGTVDTTVINTSSPSDFPFTWRDFAPTVFKNTLKIPVNICIDVYESPVGWGWTFLAEVFYPGLGPDAFGNYGDIWVYRHTEGPRPQSGYIYDQWHIIPSGTE